MSVVDKGRKMGVISCRAKTTGHIIRISSEDVDLKQAGMKVGRGNKVFIGNYEHRKSVATLIAQRMLGRKLRKEERIAFRDRDSLNLTRENIVVTSASVLGRYSKPTAGASSKFKGVSWRADRQKWIASYSLNGKSKYIGIYDREEDAARAYDAAMDELGIEIAFRNFPEE